MSPDPSTAGLTRRRHDATGRRGVHRILGIPDARLLRLAVAEASVSRVVLEGDSPAPVVEFIGGRV